MYEEYLSQTGQVAPDTSNPQNNSSSLYEQTGQSDIQNTSNGLLKGQSGVNLVLPDGSSSVAPTNSSVSVNTNSVSQLNSVPTLTVLIPTVLVLLFLVLAIIYASKKQIDSVDPDEMIEEEQNTEYRQVKVNVIESDDSDQYNITENKKTAVKKKSKKSKKRKKK